MKQDAGAALATASAALTDSWTPSTSLALGPAAIATPLERTVCASSNCHAGPWGKLWRRSGRPAIEGGWGCSKACVLALAAHSVRRELSGAPVDDVAHRHRVPLGLLLLAQGWVTQLQLQHALSSQRAAGRGRIGDWLVAECGVSPSQITRGLGAQWGCPVLTTQGFAPERVALAMPPCLRRSLGLVPLRVAARKILYIGATTAIDPAIAVTIERMTGLTVETGLLHEPDAAACIAALDQATSIACREEPVAAYDAQPQGLARKVAAALLRAQPVESRIARIGNFLWLRMWLEPAALPPEGALPRSIVDIEDWLYRLSDAPSLA